MNELHERLNAALDADERLALACDSRRWKIGRTSGPLGRVDNCSHICEENRGDDYGRMVFDVTGSGYPSSRHQAQAEHACRHDPAAVLRQVEAIRKLIAAHPYEDRGDPDEPSLLCLACGEFSDQYVLGYMRYSWPCPTIRAVAQAYGVQS